MHVDGTQVEGMDNMLVSNCLHTFKRRYGLSVSEQLGNIL